VLKNIFDFAIFTPDGHAQKKHIKYAGRMKGSHLVVLCKQPNAKQCVSVIFKILKSQLRLRKPVSNVLVEVETSSASALSGLLYFISRKTWDVRKLNAIASTSWC